MTNEELYLTGQHIEQYRHATWRPDPYYLEGLKRDPDDIRINNAYGMLLMRRGLFKEAEPYFRTAIKRLTWKNPNPYNSEAYYLLGLDLCYLGREDEAYDAFYKAAWSTLIAHLLRMRIILRQEDYVHGFLQSLEKKRLQLV